MSTTTVRLFIGGHADGRRIAVPDGFLHFQVPVPAKISFVDYSEYSIESAQVEEYRMHTLGAMDTRFRVFVIKGMTTAEALRKLIEGYNP